MALAHVSIQQLQRRFRLHAARRFVLVNRRAALRDEQIHQLLERPRLHHPDLERSDGLVVGPAAAVDGVQPLLHRDAALLQHLRGDRRRVDLDCVVDLPVDHVVARDGGGVGVAGVLDEERMARLEQARDGGGDAPVEILLVRLVVVDAEHHIAAADEAELRRLVVESGHLEHVADAITVKS